MADRRHLKRKFLYEGPKATCPCCDNEVEVRIGSTLEQPPERPWVIEEEVLRSIYTTLRNQTRERTWKGKTVLYVRCSRATLTKQRDGGSTKLMFVDLGQQRLAGPFAESSLKSYLRNRERPDGQQINTRVYIVQATTTVLRRLRLASLESTDAEIDLTDVRDLF